MSRPVLVGWNRTGHPRLGVFSGGRPASSPSLRARRTQTDVSALICWILTFEAMWQPLKRRTV